MSDRWEGYERARYRKVWGDLHTSVSHIGLHRDVLWVLETCIVHASWKVGAEEGVMLVGSQPMPLKALAELCRMTTKRLRFCLDELVRVGTARRDDGFIVLPRFCKWQESAAASRMRRKRARDSQPPVTVTPRVTSQVEGEVEGEGEVEVEVVPQPPPPPVTLSHPNLPASWSSANTPQPSPGEGALLDLNVFRQQLEGELGIRLPSWRGRGGEVAMGVSAALEDVSNAPMHQRVEQVKAVVRHAAERVKSGDVPDKYFGGMFRGRGFQAFLSEYERDVGALPGLGAAEDNRTLDEIYDEVVGAGGAS
ncbi:MAG: hypothetical protein AAF721_00320 [Myxococcota bacterium]